MTTPLKPIASRPNDELIPNQIEKQDLEAFSLKYSVPTLYAAMLAALAGKHPDSGS